MGPASATREAGGEQAERERGLAWGKTWDPWLGLGDWAGMREELPRLGLGGNPELHGREGCAARDLVGIERPGMGDSRSAKVLGFEGSPRLPDREGPVAGRPGSHAGDSAPACSAGVQAPEAGRRGLTIQVLHR